MLKSTIIMQIVGSTNVDIFSRRIIFYYCVQPLRLKNYLLEYGKRGCRKFSIRKCPLVFIELLWRTGNISYITRFKPSLVVKNK